jgi:hypothetical protein
MSLDTLKTEKNEVGAKHTYHKFFHGFRPPHKCVNIREKNSIFPSSPQHTNATQNRRKIPRQEKKAKKKAFVYTQSRGEGGKKQGLIKNDCR